METIRPLTAEDLPSAWALEMQAFNVAPSDHEPFRDEGGAERFVGAFDGERLVASCEYHRLGQFFGGRRVPMGGVASVVVAPEARGGGLASRMLALLVERMRAESLPISTLYPATPALYRSLGWEFAGHWTTYEMPVERLRGVARPDTGRVRPAEASDLEAIERVRVGLMAERNGAVDRGDWALPIYRRRLPQLFAYVSLDAAGEIDGALIYRHVPIAGTEEYDLDVRELFAASDAGLDTLLWVLASSSSVARRAFYRGWLDEALSGRLPELKPQVRHQQRWMTRVLDVPAAIKAHGAPPAMQGRVVVRVRDAMVEANDDTFAIEVSEGEARAEPVREDAGVTLGIGALSSLYTGHASSASLARLGWLEGEAPERALLDAIFAAPPPAMVDDF